MKKDDNILINADGIINSLSDTDIEEKICDKIAQRISEENSIYDIINLKEKFKNDYGSVIDDIRYFDIRDFKYWAWMHGFVCCFFIGEALILALFKLYNCFIVATLAIVFLLLSFYLYVFLCKRPKKMFRNSTPYIAIIMFALHYFLVFVDGGNKSIFLPGLLLLTTTILGLPRDNRNAFINTVSIIISVFAISVFFIPNSVTDSFILDQNQVAENEKNKLGIWLSAWMLLASIGITIMLRINGAKKIPEQK